MHHHNNKQHPLHHHHHINHQQQQQQHHHGDADTSGSSVTSSSASPCPSAALSQPHIAHLLAEFHSPHTDNQRKRQLDAQLTRHQSDAHAWPEALAALAQPPDTDPYAWHFNATTVQLAITRRWTSASSSQQQQQPSGGSHQLGAPLRQQLRDGVWQCFMSQLGTRPVRLKRDKLAQLIALMGKQDFPHEHGTYMAHVLQLLRQNFELGLALLRATSDELCSTRDDVTAQRRAEFHAALSGCVAEAMDVLVGYLGGFVERVEQLQREFEAGGKPSSAVAELEQCGNELGCGSIPRDDEAMRSAAIDCLACVQNMFAWISPDHHLSHQLLRSLFSLAAYRSASSDVCAAALTTITELFYRQVAVPQVPTIAAYLRRLLVRQLPQLRTAHELYQDKLTELLRQFSVQHWPEWTQPGGGKRDAANVSHDAEDGEDDDGGLPVVLNALYEFTFAAYGALAFTERLAIWCPLVRGLSATGEVAAEIIQLLVSGILRKFQFRFDQDAELDTLDNECADDEPAGESEWQQYLRQCIDTIVLIGERRPVPVFEQVFNDWQRPFEMFMSLQKDGCADVVQTLGDYQRCNLLRCVTRDLASLAQTLGCLIPVLHNHPAGELPANVHLLADNLVAAVAFLSPSRLHNANAVLPQIRLDFVELFAQVLLALRNFLGWSPALRSEAVLKPLIENVSHALLRSQDNPGGDQQEPRLIVLAASQLLLSITSVLRPKFALECPALQQLFQAAANLPHLDAQAAIIVQQSLVAALVVPWSLGVLSTAPTSNEQDMERRAALLQEYVAALARDLLALDHTLASGQQDKIIKIAAAALPPLAAVLEHFNEHQTHCKQMLLAAYRPCIAKSIALFGSFGAASAEVADSVLRLCLAAVRTLQQQLGGVYLKEMLHIFLEASQRGQMSVGRLRTMDRMLQMLLLVVEQPGATGLSLLPAVLTVSLDLVQQVLQHHQQQQQTESGGGGGAGGEVDLSDVTLSLFALFDGILHHRWQYFYKSQLMRGFSPTDCGDGATLAASDTPAPQHAVELLAMLTAYGHALCTCAHDPHLIALLLRSLQSLHERQQLFARPLFRDQLLQSFHRALITALIATPVGALHADAMLGVLYTMGRVSTQQLHGSFVQLGFAADNARVEQVCVAADLPTFSQRMAALIQDTRCTQLSRAAAEADGTAAVAAGAAQ